MKFATKIFLTMTALASISSILAAAVIYRKVAEGERESFIKHYRSQAELISDALIQVERTADRVGRNAVAVLKERTRTRGLPSDSELQDMAQELGVANFFATDSMGRFIRSTNGALENYQHTLFDYCEDYRQLITGDLELAQTPIVPASDEKTVGPFKYTMIPAEGRSGVLEVGISLEFIGLTFSKVVQSDSNYLGLSLYSPTLVPLGSILPGIRREKKLSFPSFENPVTLREDGMTIVSKVVSSSESCCECRVKGISNTTDPYYYYLVAEVDTRPLTETIRKLQREIGLVLTLVVLASLIISKKLSHRLVAKVLYIQTRIKTVTSEGNLDIRLKMTGEDEISELGNRLNGMIAQLASNQARLVAAEKDKAISHISSQVAHDIQSPLAALDMILSDLGSISEDKRIMIRSAVTRIKDIANDLLYRNRIQTLISPSIIEGSSKLLLTTVIESLVAEKRLQYRSTMGLEIHFELSAAIYGVFVNAQANELKRALSNLIDNSIEAFQGVGQINVSLVGEENRARLVVSDNGQGIPPDILPKLGRRGETHGKKGGSGLGLFHAIQAIERWEGKLEIRTELGRGTEVLITLPRCAAPLWFIPRLEIASQTPVVILDDVFSIHQVWKKRFEESELNKRIKVFHFSKVKEVREWVRNFSGNALYLFDHELCGEKIKGLDLIEELGIQKSAILVTSHSEEEPIREQCLDLGVKLLPKGMAGFIPIQWHPEEVGRENVRLEESAVRRDLDCLQAILIDDDELVHRSWLYSARQSARTFLGFKTVESFLKEAPSFDKKIPIYIDSCLGKNQEGFDVLGEEVAKQISEMGFKEIYLATAYASKQARRLPWIRGVRGKEPPWI